VQKSRIAALPEVCRPPTLCVTAPWSLNVWHQFTLECEPPPRPPVASCAVAHNAPEGRPSERTRHRRSEPQQSDRRLSPNRTARPSAAAPSDRIAPGKRSSYSKRLSATDASPRFDPTDPHLAHGPIRGAQRRTRIDSQSPRPTHRSRTQSRHSQDKIVSLEPFHGRPLNAATVKKQCDPLTGLSQILGPPFCAIRHMTPEGSKSTRSRRFHGRGSSRQTRQLAPRSILSVASIAPTCLQHQSIGRGECCCDRR